MSNFKESVIKENFHNQNYKTNKIIIKKNNENQNNQIQNEKLNKKKYKLNIVWCNVIGFAILHAFAIYGIVLILLRKICLLTNLWTLLSGYTSALGVTMGAHRLFTHKTYKANLIVRALLIAVFTMAGQNCLWVWARDHRQHHKYSDTDGDPHNASRGFFFSHVGWLMVRKHPDVISKGKDIDMSDLNADSLVMFQKKYYKTLFTIFSIGIPTLVPYYMWNEDLWTSFLICFITRLVIALNIAWLVNSAAHIYGNRPFTKDMLPSENGLVSFFTLGEGWHNYHHSFPWDYKAAELGQHYNFTKTIIEFCAKYNWIWDLKTASPEMVRHRIMKRGDGTHSVYGNKTIDDVNNDNDYDRLKKEAEILIHDENNNDVINDKTHLEREHKMKITLSQSIYKLIK